MAIAIANRDQRQATEILSDAIGISLSFGLLFGAATFLICPSILGAMTGTASTEVLSPAIDYVRIRQASAIVKKFILLAGYLWTRIEKSLTPCLLLRLMV